MKQILDIRLDDSNAEQVRRSHADAIRELQRPANRIVRGVSLANGVATPVAHGLGRAPSMVTTSAPRGAVTAGLVGDLGSTFTGGTIDRAQIIMLKAIGFGATITVDVEVK